LREITKEEQIKTQISQEPIKVHDTSNDKLTTITEKSKEDSLKQSHVQTTKFEHTNSHSVATLAQHARDSITIYICLICLFSFSFLILRRLLLTSSLFLGSSTVLRVVLRRPGTSHQPSPSTTQDAESTSFLRPHPLLNNFNKIFFNKSNLFVELLKIQRAQATMRQHVANEILQTEINYVKSLNIINEVTLSSL
jgi:hypothetical protein